MRGSPNPIGVHGFNSMKTLKRWLLLGAVWGVVSLVLMAFAPYLLNSHHPLLGFLIWLIVAIGWFLCGSTVSARWLNARKSRQLFLRQYPQYDHLTWVHFLNVPTQQVQQDLETLSLSQTDPDYLSLNLSPADFVARYQK